MHHPVMINSEWMPARERNGGAVVDLYDINGGLSYEACKRTCEARNAAELAQAINRVEAAERELADARAALAILSNI